MEAGRQPEPHVEDDAPTPAHAFRELRPMRRLSAWHIAPIITVAVLGSLMFAFPLAFNGGSSDLLVAVSGILITAGAASWGGLAAHRAGHSWPGLRRGPGGGRRNRKAVVGYAVGFAVVLALIVVRLVSLGT